MIMSNEQLCDMTVFGYDEWMFDAIEDDRLILPPTLKIPYSSTNGFSANSLFPMGSSSRFCKIDN